MTRAAESPPPDGFGLDWPRLTATATARAAAAQAAGQAWCGFIYDLTALRRHVGQVARSLPASVDLFYAVKANSDAPILDALADLVAGFEVASAGELDWVRARAADIPVIFGGPGKTDGELDRALAGDVALLHVESLGELERLACFARRRGTVQPILLRVNMPLDRLPDVPLAMGGRATPFGIDLAALPQAIAWLRQHDELRPEGFHLHLISGQQDAQGHLELLGGYFTAAQHWRATLLPGAFRLNVGGGIGINYRQPDRQFDWAGFAAGLGPLIAARGMADWRLRFEIGRYLTAGCGAYLMEVLDIKRTFGRVFVVGRGGTNHFRTPYAQGHSHGFRVLPVDHWSRPYARLAVADEPVTVVGQLCTPKDVLATDAPVVRLRTGDLLAFPLAGAYAWHISHHDFLRHPHPDHIYLPPCEVLDAAAE